MGYLGYGMLDVDVAWSRCVVINMLDVPEVGYSRWGMLGISDIQDVGY